MEARERRKTQERIFVKTAVIAVFLSLAACGPGVDTAVLPDDPTSEPEAPLAEEIVPPPAADLPPTGPAPSPSARDKILSQYEHLDPEHAVPDDLLEKAVLYYHENLSKITNKGTLAVIDFSKKSTLKRFFLIDMKTGKVWSIRVAHGKGTDPEHDGYANPSLFSNVSGSHASSLGFYRAAETYTGSNGLSLRLDGLSSTNSRARSRAIVIHGASYVQESNVIQGRSWGCPAVAHENRDEVIRRLKGGALIYAGLSGR